MSGQSFRFLHTSDFHLEQPLYGVAEVPEHLRDTFLDAPFQAAQQVFELAVEHQVDFVILAGDIVQFHQSGPRAAMFLADQFRRLASKGISVYWIAGDVDRSEDWPATVDLPENVRFFPSDRSVQETHKRDGVALAKIIGVNSRGSGGLDYYADGASDLYTVAIQYGEFDPTKLTGFEVSYWALGGEHNRHTIPPSKTQGAAAHYPGTVQGRTPAESTPHGVTLVHVDENKQTRLDTIEADILTWVDAKVEIDDETTRDDLREILAARASELKDQKSDGPIMIAWTITGGARLALKSPGGRLADELIQELRQESGNDSRGWTVSLRWQGSEHVPAEWYEEDSLRGDYLRKVRDMMEDGGDALMFDPLFQEDESQRQGLDPMWLVWSQPAIRVNVSSCCEKLPLWERSCSAVRIESNRPHFLVKDEQS